jgi:two-component system, NarL family, response regulator DegU
MITILLVDEQTAVRRGLAMNLALESDLFVIGEAGSGQEALELARLFRPDVVVMDLAPLPDGLAITAVLRTIMPKTAVIFHSLHDSLDYQAQALAAGATAFTSKHEGVEKLLAVLQAQFVNPVCDRE